MGAAPQFGVSISVSCPLEVLAAIDADVSAGVMPNAGLEVAGVLFGERRGSRLRILAFRPIACEYAFGPVFRLSENDRRALAAMLQGAAADRELRFLTPVGWYCSKREGAFLSEDDLAFHKAYFPQSWQLVLVLWPAAPGQTRAAYVGREPGGGFREPEAGEQFLIAPVATGPRPPAHTPRRGWLAWCALAAAVLAAIPLAIPRHGEEPALANGLALRVSDSAGQLQIQWDHQAAAVRAADSGFIEVIDGPSEVRIDVDRRQLRNGSVAYVRTSTNALIRMVLRRPGGTPLEEIVRFVGPPPVVPGLVSSLPLDLPPFIPEPMKPERNTPPRLTATRTTPRTFHPATLVRKGAPAPPAVEAPPVLDAPFRGERVARALALTGRTAPDRPPSVPPGQLIWTGTLQKGETLAIDGGRASTGHTTGSLPGGPVSISILPGEIGKTGRLVLYTARAALWDRKDAAGPQNGWRATEYDWDPARVAEVKVVEAPSERNGWKRLVLRSDKHKYTALVVRWEPAR